MSKHKHTPPDDCKYCDAKVKRKYDGGSTFYTCGSLCNPGDKWVQSAFCQHKILEQKTTLESLNAEMYKALEEMQKGCPVCGGSTHVEGSPVQVGEDDWEPTWDQCGYCDPAIQALKKARGE